MSHNATTNWRSLAASCIIGILVGLGTANIAIVGKVAEIATLLTGIRRDVDLQREDFRTEQRRTDDRINRQTESTREFMDMLRVQNGLLKQMIETKTKP